LFEPPARPFPAAFVLAERALDVRRADDEPVERLLVWAITVSSGRSLPEVGVPARLDT
jgi:hypothetical protein